MEKHEQYGVDTDGSARLTISLPAGDYGELRALAAYMRVSLAWLVRDAIRRYLRSDAKIIRERWEGDE